MVTFDRGARWIEARGIPQRARPVADRVQPRTFYALDYESSSIWKSTDGGNTFESQHTRGLPEDIHAERPTNREAPWPLVATLGRAGDLWLVVRGRLFHSTDAGRSFMERLGNLQIEMISLGKAPPGRTEPTLFAIGRRDSVRALWRSDDSGKSWLRVNDEHHEWGRRFRIIAADPRVFGRVYVGTDGRGILYGEPVK
jgi:hypothetical protein